ncbi:MAG: 50S ribosome-binding protein YggL [Victivallaceae bacterium]|nr:50S ribosome-binding protein YggL [Victivallaceae bacterium]MDD4180293.1 50S ribosome-binding protein YggL [Victivallaceae bacterium]
MNKRLRKKKFVAEFQEAGFEFFANFTAEDWERFTAKFAEIVEKHNVYFHGHCAENDNGIESIEGFVILGTIKANLDEIGKNFIKELTETLQLTNVKTGELEDAHYPGRTLKVG